MEITIELIPKQSTLDDIIGPWVNSGRSDNSKDGKFIFTGVKSYNYLNGILDIHTSKATYVYNLADFYRIKITRAE